MLKGLNHYVKQKKDDWNPTKGPAPGVKFRSGQPPPPPVWNYARDDLRAFQKWERKLAVWRVQVAAYLPKSDAAMLLYVSLRGEAEEELEWCDLSKINDPGGIDYILEALRKPLMTQQTTLKRRYLFDYETLQRTNGESVRSFVNRYHRCERSLMAVGINVGLMYDGEARGARLLERLRLSLDQQRLILVSSAQSLQFEAVKDAACTQFPEHRPPPFVTTYREFDFGGQSSGGNTGGTP